MDALDELSRKRDEEMSFVLGEFLDGEPAELEAGVHQQASLHSGDLGEISEADAREARILLPPERRNHRRNDSSHGRALRR